jgi:Zn-finger nucleic acid-binding protein
MNIRKLDASVVYVGYSLGFIRKQQIDEEKNMSDAWDDRRRAQEEGYFDTLNKQALARLAAKKGKPALKSPATGKPLEPVAIGGVVIDRCVDSGGVWFDAGELGQLLETVKSNPASLTEFLGLVQLSSGATTAADTTCTSPINGKPMAQDKILGVSIHRCSDSGGMWLEAGEINRLIDSALQGTGGDLGNLFALLSQKS